MLIRREVPDDVEAISAVHRSAFANPDAPDETPVEVRLVEALRASDAWLPELSLIAVDPAHPGRTNQPTQPAQQVVGHVVCTRAAVGATAALGLGPLGVLTEHQGQGIGHALMHAVLGAADALGERLVVLLGHADYYPRFGFHLAEEYGITPPVADWAPNFQVRTLTTYDPSMRGTFAYAPPFNDL
jgi:putative acetyltransferase